MAELASLVQRLEVAVSRLESVSGSGGSGGESAGKAPTVVFNHVQHFFESVKPTVVAPLRSCLVPFLNN